ncbi:MAG: bacillithiol system redox-active protein YtxJ [Salegentibacter sp.]
MGIIDKLFKSEREIAKQEIVEVPWHQLNKMEQLNAIEEESKSRPVAILKHSTRCGISRMVLKQFESSYGLKEDADIKLYFLDLLSHREISNEIAARFGVQHESPQLIVLRDEKVVHQASHQSIDAADLSQFVQN